MTTSTYVGKCIGGPYDGKLSEHHTKTMTVFQYVESPLRSAHRKCGDYCWSDGYWHWLRAEEKMEVGDRYKTETERLMVRLMVERDQIKRHAMRHATVNLDYNELDLILRLLGIVDPINRLFGHLR